MSVWRLRNSVQAFNCDPVTCLEFSELLLSRAELITGLMEVNPEVRAKKTHTGVQIAL